MTRVRDAADVLDHLLAGPRLEAFIVCTDRDIPVPTGVEAGDLAEPGRVYMLVRCAGCGGEHLWAEQDALLPI